MIEFNGYLSGEAEHRFFQKTRNLGQGLLLASLLLFLPPIISIGIKSKNWLLIAMYCAMFVVIPLLAHIPKTQKEKNKISPKRIYTDGEAITCIAEGYTECRLVKDAKKVLDRGEYYEIVFPFGKVSDKFICQKSLLVRGTLKEFEALFEGKIVR